VSLFELTNGAIGDTFDSVKFFLPELTLALTILLLQILRLFPGLEKIPSWMVALAGAAVALWFAAPWQLCGGAIENPTDLFSGMLRYDGLTVFIRGFLLVFAVLFILLTRLTELVQAEDDTDISILILGATLGMCLMASANHLLMVFMAVEIASVPSYAMAGMLKTRRRSSEAALKYAIYGAGTAGVMLYGISLLAGVIGTCHLPTIAARLGNPEVLAQLPTMPLVLGGLMIGVGLAFKLSAVPFHFWCPDVFEGAPAEVNGFLSVASKAAALALLVRVAIGFAGDGSVAEAPADSHQARATVVTTAPHVQLASHSTPTVTAVSEETSAPVESSGTGATELSDVRRFIVLLIGIVAAVTCTFGNLAAYGQTNIKRLLAYSTIAHAGYMLMPVAAAVALMDIAGGVPGSAIASVLFYAVTYLFMNLGAFAIVAILRNTLGSEDISDYAGLISTSPGIVVCFSLILFSLVGLPPLAGFMGKLLMFNALVESGLLWLLVIGGLNTAISLFFYLRVIKTMTIDPPSEERGPVSVPMLSMPGIYVGLITAPVLLLIVQWNGLREMTLMACEQLIK